NIEFPLTTLYLWTNLIFLGLVVFFGGEPSYTHRIVGGFVGQFIVLIMVQEALQFGIGFSTLIGSLYRVATKLAFPPDEVVESSLLYFYSGAATILLCIYAYYHLLSLPISKRCLTFGVDSADKHTEDDNLHKLCKHSYAPPPHPSTPPLPVPSTPSPPRPKV
ncbi:hypothetical protein B484DRAFT_435366, partial [Ochromonadaceae sp. CCMP2298]